MTKSELIEAIAARAELTKARAESVVDCVFDSMTEALAQGEGIEIRGFGSFTVRNVRALQRAQPAHGRGGARTREATALLQGRQRAARSS
jgi:integration host factor subunit beta